ncbi:CHTBD2 [Rachiplusia nu nucleopolyhedrovirus]|uniref:CHTBD2 n=1 Tax=Rachiplusia nu nucleopolyhedrovirus TaxID=2605775 RepID=A0AAE6IQL1_9ABAC|nr:CHTBD2 [Rachiplusia nu nucleopolyhedrovirus]QEI03583.1 CHTBD2 [Rachiplusia nu nucleopolyhedrovirus]
MWLLLGLFIIIKLFVFHQMKNLHVEKHHARLCPQGYHGFVIDPFDCNIYYLCPSKTEFYCDPDQQFDMDTQKCIEANIHDDSCMARKYRNLLL